MSDTERNEGHRAGACEEPEVEGHSHRGFSPAKSDEPNEGHGLMATEEPEVEGFGMKITQQATPDENDCPDESARAF